MRTLGKVFYFILRVSWLIVVKRGSRNAAKALRWRNTKSPYKENNSLLVMSCFIFGFAPGGGLF